MGPPDLVPPGERLHQHGWRNYLNAQTTNRPQAVGGPTIVSQVVYRSRGANPSFETQILACVPTVEGFQGRMARHIQDAVRRPLLFDATLMLILDPPGP